MRSHAECFCGGLIFARRIIPFPTHSRVIPNQFSDNRSKGVLSTYFLIGERMKRSNKVEFNGITFQPLPLSSLFIDRTMGQRTESKANIDAISSGFSLSATRVLVVSLRSDGRYAIIDGQHRFIVMMEKGEQFAMCEIHRNLTIEQEAILFEQLNRNKPLKGLQLFVARFRGSDRLALDIVNCVREYGFDIPLEPGIKSQGSQFIKCAATLYKLLHQHGFDVFHRAFDVLARCFKSGSCVIQKAALKGDFLPGLFEYLRTTSYSDFTTKAALKRISADELLGKAYAENGCNGKRCGFTLVRTVAKAIETCVGIHCAEKRIKLAA